MYVGSCLCRAVELEVDGPISDIIHCHCSKCRKSSGTAYATNGFVAASGLRISKGADKVRSYESSPGRRRHFCDQCASPIFSSNAHDPTRLRLRLGILDSDISERPISHTRFVTSRVGQSRCVLAPLAHEPGRR